jgi:glycosyltransferase involved in cell wall biosynthesis
VGIPAHGRPTFLRDAVESIIGQTLPDWRLVVGEDGPGDGAVAEAVRPYLSDPRVSYRATGRHVGAAANMTDLIRTGTAPYVALLHDDDRWEPGFLARRVEFLERHPECGMVFSGSVIIDEHGRRVDSRPVRVPPGVHPPERFVPRLLRANVVPIATVVVRRAAYEAVGAAFDPRFPHVYDYEMWLRLALRFSVGRLPTNDAHWRRHGRQSSFDGRGRGAELLAFLDHAERLVALELPDLTIPARQRRSMRTHRTLSAALDAVERGEARDALGDVARALSTSPAAALNPRLAAALAGIAGGDPGRRALGAVRRWVKWHPRLLRATRWRPSATAFNRNRS